MPDGSRDAETSVTWLQGRTFFADLRQRPGRPDMSGVFGLHDLSCAQIDWLASQEGFAGTLAEDDDCIEWTRRIDYQPPSSSADAGRVRFEEGRLIEEGRDVAYVEHWTRGEEPATAACWGASLEDAEAGFRAWIVRAGAAFMFARARTQTLPTGARLAELVRGAGSLAEKRALVDCEISLGSVGARGWRIERSTLPFREGRVLTVEVSADSLHVHEADARRIWRIDAMEGEPRGG
jgi:hypothetical protein